MKSLGSLALLCLLATTGLVKAQQPALVADKQVVFKNEHETHIESSTRLIQLAYVKKKKKKQKNLYHHFYLQKQNICSENEEPKRMSESDIFELIRQRKKFMDVTDYQDRVPKTATTFTRVSSNVFSDCRCCDTALLL